MPQTVLVRIADGFIHGVSQSGADFNDALTAKPGVYQVLTDPTWADGPDLADANGDRSALGFAKMAVILTNTIRNATQLEIDAWAATEAVVKNVNKADELRALLGGNTVWKRLIKSVVRKMVVQGVNNRVDPSARTGNSLTNADIDVIISKLID